MPAEHQNQRMIFALAARIGGRCRRMTSSRPDEQISLIAQGQRLFKTRIWRKRTRRESGGPGNIQQG
jgi:hypothetical protein